MVMKPPTGGPSTGPISAGIVSQAREPTSSFFGTVRRITSRPTGTIMAPPTPCTIRAPMISGIELERPASAEPSANTAIAARNTSRAPSRSASQPDTGMKTARLSR